MKRIFTYPSLIFLIVANLVPIYQILFANLSVFELLLIYWVEGVAIGFFTVLKMLKAGASYFKDWPQDLFWSIFVGSLLLLFDLAFILKAGHLNTPNGVPYPIFFTSLKSVFIPFLAFFISHGFSYLNNFIGKQEYKSVTKESGLSGQALGRISYLLVVPFFGVFALKIFDLSINAILIFIVVKIALDIYSHLHEHSILKS